MLFDVGIASVSVSVIDIDIIYGIMVYWSVFSVCCLLFTVYSLLYGVDGLWFMVYGLRFIGC